MAFYCIVKASEYQMSCRNISKLVFGLRVTPPCWTSRYVISSCRSCVSFRRPSSVPRINFPNQNIQAKRNVTQDSSAEVTVTDEQDTLYREIDIYLKGHEVSVLESYVNFVKIAADELNIEIAGVLQPTFITDRITLLRSVHIYKNHRVQYEAETHSRVIQLKHLTGSTADAFLTYLQINIPAGVAMHVHKWSIESLPTHLAEEMERNSEEVTSEDEKIAENFRARMADSKLTTPGDYQEYQTTKRYLIGTSA